MKAIPLLLFLFVVLASGQQSNPPDYGHVNITVKTEGGPCGMVCPLNDCLSCCPSYSVSLDENGTVIYNGISGVKTRGEKVHSIDVSAVRDLVGNFLSIDFYSLPDRFTEKRLPNGQTQTIDHSNATTISIDIDGKKKSVYIFYGAPDELTDLQRKFYEVTQIAKYTGRP